MNSEIPSIFMPSVRSTCSLVNCLTVRMCWPTSGCSRGDIWKWDACPTTAGPGPDCGDNSLDRGGG